MAAPSIGATHAQALTLRICRRTLAPALLAFIGVLSSTAAQAYKPGDTVEPAVLERLGATGSRITIVDFFAEWCVSCRKELPLISAVNARSDQRKVEFVGIDTDDNPATAEAFQKELKARSALNFRVVNDPTQSLVGKFKPRGYPRFTSSRTGRSSASTSAPCRTWMR